MPLLHKSHVWLHQDPHQWHLEGTFLQIMTEKFCFRHKIFILTFLLCSGPTWSLPSWWSGPSWSSSAPWGTAEEKVLWMCKHWGIFFSKYTCSTLAGTPATAKSTRATPVWLPAGAWSTPAAWSSQEKENFILKVLVLWVSSLKNNLARSIK